MGGHTSAQATICILGVAIIAGLIARLAHFKPLAPKPIAAAIKDTPLDASISVTRLAVVAKLIILMGTATADATLVRWTIIAARTADTIAALIDIGSQHTVAAASRYAVTATVIILFAIAVITGLIEGV